MFARRVLLATWIVFLLGYSSVAHASLSNDVSRPVGVATIGALGTALSKSDVALCKSVVVPAHLRGDVGEAFMGKFVLEQQLSQSGNWRALNTRLGRQGIDGLYIKYDDQGRPRRIIVAEAKYGNSQLGNTKSGWQLSERWTQKNLLVLSKRYNQLANMKNVGVAKLPTYGKIPAHMLEIDLGNGKKGVFWRQRAGAQWHYDGPPNSLEASQRKARTTGVFLEGAAEGKIRVSRRLFKFKVDGNTLKVQVADGVHINANGKIPKSKFTSYDIDLAGLNKNAYAQKVRNEITTQIRKKMPQMTVSEARKHADEIVKDAKNFQKMVELSRKNLAKPVAMNTLGASGVGVVLVGGFSLLEQAVSNSKIDWAKVGKDSVFGGVTVGAGVAAGQGTVIALTESQLGYSLMRNTATSIGLPTTSLAINLAGSWVGGSLASILYSYGGVWTGAYEIEEANRSAIIGTMATTGGVAAYGGTLGLATVIGSASSGTAISTLNGAAASNAALAWLGGGALNAGGGGVATGTVVLGGVVTVVVVAVTLTATYAFYLYDERQEDIRQRSMTHSLLYDDDFLEASLRHWYQ